MPYIDKVYAFEDAVQAFEHLARGPFGKIVIRVADVESEGRFSVR